MAEKINLVAVSENYHEFHTEFIVVGIATFSIFTLFTAPSLIRWDNRSVINVSLLLLAIIADVAGIIAVTGLPYWLIIGIIVATYAVRYLSTGFYYVLIKKYITNFTNGEVANKVYSAHSFVIGLGNLIICAFGAVISSNFSVKHSMIIFVIVFFTIMILILNYMRTRVGLDPNSYRKKDINYKEYIGLK